MPLSCGEIHPFLLKLPKIGEFHCNVRLVYMLTNMWSGCKVDWVALSLNLPVSEEDTQVPNGSECLYLYLYLYTQFSVGWRRSCSMHWTLHCQCQACVFACLFVFLLVFVFVFIFVWQICCQVQSALNLTLAMSEAWGGAFSTAPNAPSCLPCTS